MFKQYLHELRPIANAELVPKFHVALHASHAPLPILSKFRPKLPPPHFNINISENAALLKLMSEFKIPIECSKNLLNLRTPYLLFNLPLP
jgi:hypothetical protein